MAVRVEILFVKVHNVLLALEAEPLVEDDGGVVDGDVDGGVAGRRRNLERQLQQLAAHTRTSPLGMHEKVGQVALGRHQRAAHHELPVDEEDGVVGVVGKVRNYTR